VRASSAGGFPDSTMTAAESWTEEINTSSGPFTPWWGREPVHSRIRGSVELRQVRVPRLDRMCALAWVTGIPARNPKKLSGGSSWVRMANAESQAGVPIAGS